MPPPEANFISFVASLAAMAYKAMGVGQAPAPEKVDLQEARYLIDVIDVLEEKTKGNLTPGEEKTLKEILYPLRMNYIRLTEKGSD